MIDYLHQKDEDLEDKNDPNVSREERQLRESLRLTVGELNTDESHGTYWDTDDNLRKLLRLRPSIEHMELIRRPMCNLSKSKKLKAYQNLDAEKIKRRKYFVTLQKQLVEHFLDEYKTKRSS